MPDVSINLNDTVRVKLNDVGLAIYRQAAEDLRASLPEKAQQYVATEPKIEPDGTYRTQMWAIMQMFGPHLSMGSEQPFGTEVILEIPVQSKFD